MTKFEVHLWFEATMITKIQSLHMSCTCLFFPQKRSKLIHEN